MNLERVGNLSCAVGESPVWSAREQAWYWVDIVARRIWRLDAAGALRSWETPEMVACIAPKERGGLVAGMETALFSVGLDDEPQAHVARLASPGELGEGMRFNDGRCDRQGRFWAGTMFMDMGAARPVGQLYCYTPGEGLSQPVVSGLLTQNGLAFSPDGRTMYLSDSHPNSQQIWAFDYDTERGMPMNQRLFVDMRPLPGRPDGAAMDVDGCYWICGNDAGCILRFTPDGKLDRRVDVPMAKPSMCAFGGADMRTLLVTSIGAGQPADSPMAGAVITLRPGAEGMPEQAFRG